MFGTALGWRFFAPMRSRQSQSEPPQRSPMVSIAVRRLSLASIALFSLATTLVAQSTQHYTQTNLVSDTPGVATTTDPNLVNAWGMSRSSTSPWWVSDNGAGVSTLFMGTGTPVNLVVTIPPADNTSQTGTPTGQVFNGTNDFQLTAGNPARFIFVTEDGTVSGWNPAVQATTAVVMVNTHSASVFKGAALASASTGPGKTANFLYVADFRKAHVNVYDASFHHVALADGAFEDESLPDGFAPFNVQNIGGDIYVVFAKQDSAKHDEVDGSGLGYVDVFSTGGHLLRRLQHGSWFNAPWGITQAPADFGAFSHDILVGQFGNGHILAFDPATGNFRQALVNANNTSITIDGLWGIAFGGGTASGPYNALFFTAGPGGEQHGLFGTITPIENALGGDQ
jgi:uncharacterized protein (TIGR03118 family)